MSFLEEVQQATSLVQLAYLASRIEDNREKFINNMAVAEAALPLIRSTDDVIALAGCFNLKTGTHIFVRLYAERTDLCLTDAVRLHEAIQCAEFGGAEAQKAIISAVEPLLKIRKGDPLEKLAEIAAWTWIHDGNNDGSGSQAMEDGIIGAALRKAKSVEEAVTLAKAFGTDTGAHRWIIAFTKKNGVSSLEDAHALAQGTRNRWYMGEEAINAILEAAKASSIEVTFKDLTGVEPTPEKCKRCGAKMACPSLNLAPSQLFGAILLSLMEPMGPEC